MHTGGRSLPGIDSIRRMVFWYDHRLYYQLTIRHNTLQAQTNIFLTWLGLISYSSGTKDVMGRVEQWFQRWKHFTSSQIWTHDLPNLILLSIFNYKTKVYQFCKGCHHPDGFLIFKLMSHLSYVTKFTVSQYISHVNWYCTRIQITRGRVDFKGDCTVKSPCWHWVLNLWPSDPDLRWFTAVPSL